MTEQAGHNNGRRQANDDCRLPDSCAAAGRRCNVCGKFHGLVIFFCVVLVLTWQILGGLTRGSDRFYAMSAGDFAGFQPMADGFQIVGLTVRPDPIEPTILGFEIMRTGNAVSGAKDIPVLVRLVHGYNMRDCMRIKGYIVDRIGEKKEGSIRTEFWRLTSSAGDVSIWATGILSAGNFAGTALSVLDMPFPRVGVPDDPSWVPRGMIWADLRHPIDYAGKLLRNRWNTARCDWLVFLGLKQPVWASSDHVTLVASWQGNIKGTPQEAEASVAVEEAYRVIWTELKNWNKKKPQMNSTRRTGADKRR